VRADAAEASRRHEVRAAARLWRTEGVIDDPALAAIEARYPDDRYRLGWAFRVMLFVFTVIAAHGAMGFLGLVLSPRRDGAVAALLLFGALVLAAATELLVGPLKRAQSGAESAAGLLAVGYGALGMAFLVDRPLASGYRFFDVFMLSCASLGALAAWRWGFPFLAALAALAAYALLARNDHGRLLWIVAAAALIPMLLRASESARLPPPHRRSCLYALVVSIVALYVAVHIGSLDGGLLEFWADFRSDSDPARHDGTRFLAVLATALLPVILIAAGALTRRRVLIDVGVLTGIASLVTLRFYVHVAPLWVVLIGSGTAAMALVLGLRRFLASGPDEERGGFTARPLFEDAQSRHLMEVAGVIATFSPEARDLSAPEGTLKPGGGAFGGGGATGNY
jgi:hypothetical protein